MDIDGTYRYDMVSKIGVYMLIGAHVSASGGINRAIANGEAIGADCIQIFIGSPRTWRFVELSEETIHKYKDALENSISVRDAVVHASYLINLGSSDRDLFARSKSLLMQTVTTACAIEANAVILHVGSHKGEGMDQVHHQIRDVFEEIQDRLGQSVRTRLLIENTAGAGGTIGGSLPEIHMLLTLVENRDRIGFCLDTQHLFAFGYDFRDEEVRDRVFQELSDCVGKIDCVHLNDSKTAPGGMHDRHENLGDGEIGLDALRGLLKHPMFSESLIVLEVPGDGAGPRSQDVELAKRILGD